MAVPKAAVNKYLTRKVDNRSWMKNLKPLEIVHDLSYVNPPHKFRIPLRDDQKICFLMGLTYPKTVFQTDLGLGKTGVSLELLSYFYEHNFIRRAFVFAPTNEVSEGWEDEIKKWGFTLPYVRLSASSSRGKWEQFAALKTGIVIGTYAGISAMAARLTPVEGEDKRARVIDDRLLLRLVRDVDAVVYDQSTKLGNTDSLSFQVCKEFSVGAQIKYGLAGRAFGRDPFVLFSQFFLVDQGIALGRSPGMFREAFWRRVKTGYGTKWIFRKRRESDLARFIAASSIRYSVDECLQLPPKVYVQKECEFPAENWQYYDQIIEELTASRGNYREVKNSFLRMRQIASGFVGFKDDETGERAQIEFAHNPKLDLLMALIEQVPSDQKMVIFHEFTWSGARICQALTKLKIEFGWLWSGTKDWTQIKEAFKDNPNFRVIVANWKKASMGLNLQSASYMFFYESPVSAIERYESEGRIYRNGQKRKSMIYDVMVKDSVDERIREFHAEGRDLYKALVDNPATIIGWRKQRIL